MTVFLSTELSIRYQYIFQIISGILKDKGIECDELKCHNIWARDFMPIKSKNGYTKFTYKTVGYHKYLDEYPQLHVPVEVWHDFCTDESPIILDGGNVEQNDKIVLMTEMILRQNKNLVLDRSSLSRFRRSLELTFGKEIIFLPVEPMDTLGHIDGIARFVDEKMVLINDYSGQKDEWYNDYQERIKNILTLNNFEVRLLPNAYHKMPKMTEEEFRAKYPAADDFNPGYGYYINFYKVADTIFMPAFDVSEDSDCYRILKDCFPYCEVIPVNCVDISMEGGLLNCTTWEYEKVKRNGLS